MDTYDVVVTARSNRDLTSDLFERQVALLKSVLEWDAAAYTWRVRYIEASPEHISDAINTLFETARLYGTAVTLRLEPRQQDQEPEQPGERNALAS